MMFRQFKYRVILCVSLLLIAGLCVYNVFSLKAYAQGEAGAPPQAMPVKVLVADTQPIQIWNDFSARIEAVDFAEIRPQVSGTITSVKFEDGQNVEKGELLFIIDPKPFQASVNQAKADLEVVRSQLDLAQKEFLRAQELVQTDAIPQRVFDERESTFRVAQASIESAKARLETAIIDLNYAYVKAPIDGRISRAEIKKGNLVQTGNNAPLLTTIIATDHVYADFEVDEQTYLTYIRNTAKDQEAESQIPVRLSLQNDSVEYDGFIHSFDNQIDAASGTIRARALFKNEDGALLPGMFASVKMGSSQTNDEILIPEKAISTDQTRKFIYVVNDKNIVEYRQIEIGESIAGQRVVQSGLAKGEKIITDGIIRIRPGMPVKPQMDSKPPPDTLLIPQSDNTAAE